MFNLTRSQVQHYGFAVGVVVLALVLTLILDPWLGMTKSPFLLFFGAVMVSAGYGGTGAGLLATVLSALTNVYFFLEPLYSLAIDLPNGVRLMLFALEGVLFSVLCGVLRKANQRLDRSLRSLTATETRYRRIIDTAYEGIWVIDAEARTEYVNQRLAAMFGYAPEEMLARPIFDFIDKSSWTEVKQRIENRKRGIPEQFDFRYRRKDGSDLWAIVSTNPIFNHEGEFVGSLAMLTDISDRKQVEAALRNSKERLILAQKVGKIGTCEWNVQTQQVIWTEEMEALYGIPPGSFDGRYETWVQALHPDDRTKINQEAFRTVTEGIDFDTQFRILLPDGNLRWIAAKAALFSDDTGKPDRVIGVNMDITEHKRSQEALKDSEERLRLAVEGADLGMWDYHLQSGRLIWSDRCKAMFDLTPDTNMTYEIFLGAVHPEDREKVDQAVRQAIANQEDYDIEMRSLWSNGTIHWIRSIGHAYYNKQGQPIRMAGVALDITERKQADEALRQSEARFAKLAENVPGVIYQYRQFPDGRNDFPYISSGCLELYGIESYEIQQNPHLALEAIHPDDLETFRQSLNLNTPAGEQWRHEWRIITPLGEIKWLQGIARPERQPDGVILWDGLLLDITGRKQGEKERERLLAREQSAREAAESANRIKDEFLAVLSHELRTPLNPILGWAKMLRTRKLDGQTAGKALETIERNAQLQVQLIDDLLDVSRILRGKLSLNVSPVRLETIIPGALETVRLAAEAKGIELQTRLDPDIGTVLGDSGRLQQVVWNLLSNAVKFTPIGGRVEVQLGRIQQTSKAAGETIYPLPLTEYAQITVSDTGIGIEPEFVPYVFDYFRQADSSTSRKYGGLGLGLAIVRHIVELHGGVVRATSSGEGQGATFIVRLPLVQPESKRIKAQEKSSLVVSASCESCKTLQSSHALTGVKVLVVDDELDTRELIAFILEQAGATVTITASALGAVELLTFFKPDVLVSDIGMPEMDGYALMRQIRTLTPEQGGEVPAIALTAYARDEDRNRALQAGFQKHLSKPIEPSALIAAVASLLKITEGC